MASTWFILNDQEKYYSNYLKKTPFAVRYSEVCDIVLNVLFSEFVCLWPVYSIKSTFSRKELLFLDRNIRLVSFLDCY